MKNQETFVLFNLVSFPQVWLLFARLMIAVDVQVHLERL